MKLSNSKLLDSKLFHQQEYQDIINWCQSRNILFIPTSIETGEGIISIYDFLIRTSLQLNRKRDINNDKNINNQHVDQNLSKQLNTTLEEDRSRWVSDDDVLSCFQCEAKFSVFLRKHHCRRCGFIFCNECSKYRLELPIFGYNNKVRICGSCYRQEMNAINV